MRTRSAPTVVGSWLFLLIAGAAAAAHAATANQQDIAGPASSVAFGTKVVALANGNIVVTDPDRDTGTGAVYLYSPDGQLISTLTGDQQGDHVGYSVVELANGNFVVSSPNWHGNAGAATWVDAEVGLSGVVTEFNSLVGSQASDGVEQTVVPLTNGNYVVSNPSWNQNSGAVTWGNGATGFTGQISADSSFVGQPNTFVGNYGIVPLANGNYVILSPGVTINGVFAAGAVTWASGSTFTTGSPSPSNSLYGGTEFDRVGDFVVPLKNGNYVVVSVHWHFVGEEVGAVTWGNGTTGSEGLLSSANSLVRTGTPSFGIPSVVPLTNGNYVVASPSVNLPGVSGAGAVTWADGTAGAFGAPSEVDSLVGSSPGDAVGAGGVVALANGNYVVSSPDWSDGVILGVGAVTWGDGAAGTKGQVSKANSLVGSTQGDHVGGVTALDDANYVVSSAGWSNGQDANVGAATWRYGGGPDPGGVSPANSLVGSTGGDFVGSGVLPLGGGRYAVVSPLWHNGAVAEAGAVTWRAGGGPAPGVVSAANSLVGTTEADRVGSDSAYGFDVVRVGDGNYVVQSPDWDNGPATNAGAVTWVDGKVGLTGPVSTANSMTGGISGDRVGSSPAVAYDDGNFAFRSGQWAGAFPNVGAVTLGLGDLPLPASIQPDSSVIGAPLLTQTELVFDYDPAHSQLVVGQARANKISLLVQRPNRVFGDGYE